MDFFAGMRKTIVTYSRRGARLALDRRVFAHNPLDENIAPSNGSKALESASVSSTTASMPSAMASFFSFATPKKASVVLPPAEGELTPSTLRKSYSVDEFAMKKAREASSSDVPQITVQPSTPKRAKTPPPVMSTKREVRQTKPMPKDTVTLGDILQVCGQETTMTMDELIGKKTLKTCHKIGESTFAEVFRAQHDRRDVAIKVLPFGGAKEINGSQQTRLCDVYQELRITQILSPSNPHGNPAARGPASNNSIMEADDTAHLFRHGTHASFIEAIRVGVCRGPYSPRLLTEWDAYADANESENDRPDFFDDDQLYAVLILAHGGKDLEHSTLESMTQARSVLLQVCLSLASVEQTCKFEHRDLHWGNVLVRSTERESFNYLVNGRMIAIAATGVQATIIDYTLSRMESDGELLSVPLSDESFFTGEGDYQFEIYRKMRTETEERWAEHHPRTNVFWVHYLVDKMMHEVAYAKGSSTTKSKRGVLTDRSAGDANNVSAAASKKQKKEEMAALAAFKDRVLGYATVDELVRDEIFADLVKEESVVNMLALMSL